jgi:hypothetical protein
MFLLHFKLLLKFFLSKCHPLYILESKLLKGLASSSRALVEQMTLI